MTHPANRWLRPLLVAAAIVAAFAIGRVTSSQRQATVGQRWLLMLYEDRDFEAPPPDKQVDRVEEYRRWGAQVRALDGAELGPDGYLIERDAAPSLVEPDQQPLGRAAGFFIVTAASLEQAKRIATTCPHLKYHGRVVVRPLS